MLDSDPQGAATYTGTGTDQVPPAETPAHYGRQLRNSMIGLAVVVAIVVALLLAVPGLQGVADRVGDAKVGWLVVAIVLELLSCIGFVLSFQLVFDRGPRRVTARLAWAELAANAVLPAGGASGLGLGAWLMSSKGVPGRRIAERSAVIFLLTSAVNVAFLILLGVGLGSGLLSGTHSFVLTFVPAAVGVAAVALTLLAARSASRAARRQRQTHRRLSVALGSLATGVSGTLRLLREPDWRLIGAIAYWVCDVGVLWVSFMAFGHAPPFAVVGLAYLLGMLGGALPIPGGVGAVDGGLIGALLLYGVPVAPAAAAVLVYRAIALWVPALIGTVAFLLLRRSLHQAETPRAQGPDPLPVAAGGPGAAGGG